MIVNKEELRQFILKSEIFCENEYLEKYLDLCMENLNTKKEKFKTEKHHILPRCYFKDLNIEIDNSKNNLINLSYENHILAHYYLCGMIRDITSVLYDKLCYAFYKMTNNKIKNVKEEDFINYFLKYKTYKQSWHNYVLNVGSKSQFKKGQIPWNKGLTKENNKSLQIISQKISEKQIGRKPWNTGLTKEDDLRLVYSAAKRLRTLFEKTGYYGTNNGKTFSEETKQKMSENMKTKHLNDVWITNGQITKHVDLETYEKDFKDWELGRKTKNSSFKAWNKGKHYTEEHKKKLSNSALHRKPLSEEELKQFKEKCSIASKKRVENRTYLFYCREDNLYFKSLKSMIKFYNISEYFIKKSIKDQISVNEKTFFKITKSDINVDTIIIFEEFMN